MKLAKMMSFMLGTKDEVLNLSADDSQHFHLHIKTAFGTNLDMRSHTGGAFVIVFGAMPSRSTKKKMISRSSTEK